MTSNLSIDGIIFALRVGRELGLVLTLMVAALTAARADETEAERPRALTDPAFWTSRQVIQTRGWVLDHGDNDGIIRKRYWVLGPAAIGIVEKVLPSGEAVCVFPNYKVGWDERGINEQDRRRTEQKIEFDQYNKELRIDTYSYSLQGIPVERSDHGVIEDDEEERKFLRVRFPINCIGLTRPRIGAKVVRGPDWNAGRIDGGATATGELIDATKTALWGTVISERDKDGYVKVEWNETGRNGKHRFDCRRYYDIVVLPEADRPDGLR